MNDLVLENSGVAGGEQALSNGRHEQYCQSRSLAKSRIESARHAGYGGTLHALRGNAARLERRADINARIAYLARQEEEILAANRRWLIEEYRLLAESNEADLWETVEKEKDGKLVRYQRAKLIGDLPEEIQRTIESIHVTEDGRLVPKRYNKYVAMERLSKLWGLDSTHGNREGDFNRMSDDELIAALQSQADALGIKINLSYEFYGK